MPVYLALKGYLQSKLVRDYDSLLIYWALSYIYLYIKIICYSGGSGTSNESLLEKFKNLDFMKMDRRTFIKAVGVLGGFTVFTNI